MAAIDAFDPRKEAFIHREFEPLLNGLQPVQAMDSRIDLVSYRPDLLVYEYSAQHDGLAVFSEIWYDKGWKAYVNGRELPILRANYILRALPLPGGNGTVEFRFEPRSYHTGETVSLIASLILLIVAVAAAWVARRKQKAEG